LRADLLSTSMALMPNAGHEPRPEAVAERRL
jgi:hypothetical protein